MQTIHRRRRIVLEQVRCVAAGNVSAVRDAVPIALGILFSALPALSGTALALPTGGQVAAGQAAIATPATGQMQINQGTPRAVINWNSFGIAANESVNISQPTSQSALLNRVTGNTPSEIYGRLTANGQVFLINPNGVLFGRGASVNVGGLVASSLNINDNDFMDGNLSFHNDGSADNVANQGEINAGFAALLGPRVNNSGHIVTTKGSAALGGGAGSVVNGAGRRTIHSDRLSLL